MSERKDDKPISTFVPERGHNAEAEREPAGTVRRRYHAGHPDTSGENDLPEGGTLPIHQHEKR